MLPIRSFNSENDGAVKVWEGYVVKPTYRILREDNLPYFMSKYYPYTRLDFFDYSEPTPVKYKELVVENEYLKISVRPEFGARLFSAFDKISENQVFHYVDTIKPFLIAQRGAWIAGGLEFNLCQHPSHTADNFSPVDYTYVKNEDGSASILIGNLILYTNVRYLVEIALRPKTARIDVRVKIFNTDLIPQRYYFWSNAAVSASENLRFFYPGSLSNIGKFPVNEEGIDLSWYVNYDRPLSIFILDSEEDFFAAYDYKSSKGLVHYADHNIIPGKKIFSWGLSEDGLFWKDLLSDKGIPYVEIQSGRFLTQGIVELIDPLNFESWEEYWYPVRDMDGITYANEKVAIYINEENKAERKLQINVCSAISCKARLILYAEGEKFHEELIELLPEKTLKREVRAPLGKLLLKIIDVNGGEIISWDFRSYRTKPHEAPSWIGEVPNWNWGDTAEELWLKGVDSLKRETFLKAERYFTASLEKDGAFSKSLCALGLLYYRSGLYDKAVSFFQRALMRNPYDEEARYYLGLTMLVLNNLEEAERELWKVSSKIGYRPLALYLLGIIRMRLNAYRDAEDMLQRAIKEYSYNLKALCTLSMALRKQGKREEAWRILEEAHRIMPLDYLVLAERYLLSSDEEFKRVVFTSFQKVLEASKDYIFAGLFDDSLAILKAALEHGIRNPLIYYYIGYSYKKMGRFNDAIDYYKYGGRESIDYVFPHRLEDLEVLKDVVSSLPLDPTPHYLLGNVLFYLGRFKEGLEEWEKAYMLGLRNAVLCRNIAHAHALLTFDYDRAINMYLEAIRLEPENHKLYVELDDIYSKTGDHTERVKLLENIPRKAKHSALLARLASAYVDTGEYEKALNILCNTFFEPMEGYYGFWEIYVDALMAKGFTLFKSCMFEDAAKCFIEAMSYPKNLGVGAPHPKYRRDLMQLYYAGLSYEKLGELSTAQRIWSAALQRISENPENHVFKALILRKLGRVEESRLMLRKVVEEAKLELNRLSKEFGDEDSYLASIHGTDVSFANLHYVLGLGYIAQGMIEAGIEEVDKSLKLTKVVRHARWIKDGTIPIPSLL
ncbi:MAG: DUF5107 domain-containing protein [Candidatus Bathyarchaeia archaeon]